MSLKMEILSISCSMSEQDEPSTLLSQDSEASSAQIPI